MNWNVIIAKVLDNPWGFQSANKVRENLICLASRRATYHLGGSRQISLPLVGSVQDAIDYLDVELNGDNVGGFTVSARIECRTGNAATAIIPQIYNVTDATVAIAGASCASTTFGGTNGIQTLTVPIASGTKKYRLRGTPSNALNPVYLIGYLEIYADS